MRLVIVYRTDEWFFSEEPCPTVGIDETKQADNLLLSNPVKDRIVFNPELLEKPYHVEIIDMHGKVVLHGAVSHNSNSVDISFLSSGLYIYVLTHEGAKIYSGKLNKIN